MLSSQILRNIQQNVIRYYNALLTFVYTPPAFLLFRNEKEGIPPTLLPIVDICVEIPQLGLVRSLNVHVAGAIFIWEYVKQFLKDDVS